MVCSLTNVAASKAQTLGKNVLRIAPVTFFYGGIGGSISYERFIDKNQQLSFYLPIHAGVRSYYIGQESLYGYYTSADEDNYSIMVQPGIKMYPMGSHRKVNFAMAASAFVTYGTDKGYKVDLNANNYYQQYDDGREMRIGTTMSPSFTAQLSPSFNVGLEAFLGLSVYNKYKSDLFPKMSQGPLQTMAGISFQIGYRF
jgi:hypothetical protein